MFWHPTRAIRTLVHGDDYVSGGDPEELEWLETELAKEYEIQTQKIGFGKDKQEEGKVLNRIIRCTESGWELEADPRHAELVIEQLGVDAEKGVISPGVSGAEEEDHPEDKPLEGQDITRYRAVTARCNYLGADRPDCVFAIKEGCREMCSPTTGSLRRLRRIAKYLKAHPRLVWHFDMQAPTDILNVFSDADWAGCRRTRKSTSGGAVMLGSHCIKTWSKTQAVIAKSSAESELYGVVRGACEGLGMKTLLKDLGEDIQIRLNLDATAAKGILERQGIAKIRHIDVNVLWLQEQCAKKLVPLVKVPGEENPADLMTKHLVGPVIAKHLKCMNLTYTIGRAKKAAQLHGVSGAPAGGGRKWPGGDYWSEKGESGRWVRVHRLPRRSLFTPMNVPGGPGRDTSLMPDRTTAGVDEGGMQFADISSWCAKEERHTDIGIFWTGKSIFNIAGRSNRRYVNWADLED